MDNKQAQDVEKLEKEAKYKVIQLASTDDEKHLLEDTRKELYQLYQDFHQWVSKNIDSEEFTLRFEKLKHDSFTILEKGKAKLTAFSQQQSVQKTKDKVIDVGEKVIDGVSDGVHTIMELDMVRKTVDSISDTIQTVKQDERVKDSVKKLKRGTLKAAQNALQSLEKVLDTKEERDESQKG